MKANTTKRTTGHQDQGMAGSAFRQPVPGAQPITRNLRRDSLMIFAQEFPKGRLGYHCAEVTQGNSLIGPLLGISVSNVLVGG